MEATVAVTKAATIGTSDQSTSASLSLPGKRHQWSKHPVVYIISIDQVQCFLFLVSQKNFQNDDNTKKRKQDTTEDTVEVYV